MKNAILYILPIIAMLAASCNDDEYYRYGDFRYDMVTYMGHDETLGGDAYINYPTGDNSAVTLIDPQSAASTSSAGLETGSRLLLNYIIDSRNSDGSLNVTARSYTKAITDSLRYIPNLSSMAMDSISLNSIWRTGRYINLYCRVKYTYAARQIALVADYSTLHNDTVHCYLMHNMLGVQAYFWRRCYMSFDISSVWNLQSCKTVRIHLNDVTYPDRKYYDFTKTN